MAAIDMICALLFIAVALRRNNSEQNRPNKNAGTRTMTISDAEHIMDIVRKALAQESRHGLHPLSSLEGYDVFQIDMASKLLIANDFLILSEAPNFEEKFSKSIEFYRIIRLIISDQFVPDKELEYLARFASSTSFEYKGLKTTVSPSPLDKSAMICLGSLETASSFGDYCKHVGSEDQFYWQKIYTRIDLEYTFMRKVSRVWKSLKSKLLPFLFIGGPYQKVGFTDKDRELAKKEFNDTYPLLGAWHGLVGIVLTMIIFSILLFVLFMIAQGIDYIFYGKEDPNSTISNRTIWIRDPFGNPVNFSDKLKNMKIQTMLMREQQRHFRFLRDGSKKKVFYELHEGYIGKRCCVKTFYTSVLQVSGGTFSPFQPLASIEQGTVVCKGILKEITHSDILLTSEILLFNPMTSAMELAELRIDRGSIFSIEFIDASEH